MNAAWSVTVALAGESEFLAAVDGATAKWPPLAVASWRVRHPKGAEKRVPGCIDGDAVESNCAASRGDHGPIQ